MRRRGFVLLEVFIALALITLTIIPITSYPMRIYQKEIEHLRKIEVEHLYDLAMATFVKTLTTLTWDKVEGPHDIAKYATPLQKEPYLARVEIEIAEELPEYRLLKCTLWIDSFEREYLFLIHKT